MLWLLFALFAAAGFGLVSLIDKLFVSKFLKSQRTYYCWWGVYSLAVSPFFLLFLGGPLTFNIFAVIAGVVGAISSRIYLAAISEEDISNVSPIFFTSPLFTLILSVLFLSEALTAQDYAGVIVVVLGAVLMGVRDPQRLKLSKGVKIAILCAAIGGLYSILYKLATTLGNPFQISFWEWLSYGLVVIPLTGSHAGEAARRLRKLTPGQLGLMLLAIPLVALAFLALITAYSLEAAPLVAAAGSSQPLFVFLYAAIASIFIPKLLKEEFSRKTILFKILGGILIVVGVFLVN